MLKFKKNSFKTFIDKPLLIIIQITLIICLNSFGAEIKTDKNNSKIEKQEFQKDLKANSKSITLHFTGTIDGSDEILITNEKAIWKHKYWGWPTDVKINGIKWNPQKRQTLHNRGFTQYLKLKPDWQSARIEIVKARDLVVVESSSKGLTIHLNDTPDGPQKYDFKVYFDLKKPEERKNVFLFIEGNVDGSDEVLITNEKAIWKHKHWGWPTNVKINGISWNPQKTPFLLNRGKTKYLKNNVDFSHIRILYKSGRDSVIAVPEKNSIKIYFADNPIGAGVYKLNLAF